MAPPRALPLRLCACLAAALVVLWAVSCKPPECELGPDYADVSNSFAFGSVEGWSYAGVATVTGHSPAEFHGYDLALEMPDAGSVVLSYTLASRPALPLDPGDPVDVSVDVYNPWWWETKVVLRRPAEPGEAVGRLVAAIWASSEGPASVVGLPLAYREPDCPPFESECRGDETKPMILVAGGAVEVPAGTELPYGEYAVGNSSTSTRIVGEMQCEDVSQDWFAGYVLPSE